MTHWDEKFFRSTRGHIVAPLCCGGRPVDELARELGLTTNCVRAHLAIGCTKQACVFRDNYEVFKKRDAEVIGISSDSVESHRGFAAKHDLPYTLLSDEQRKVRKLYGVPNTLGLFPGRVTYVIDREGIVRHVFSSQLGTEKHVEEAIKALQFIS